MSTLEEKLNNMPEDSKPERDDFDFYTDLQNLVKSIQTFTGDGSIHCQESDQKTTNVREMIGVIRSAENFIEAGEEILSYRGEYLPDEIDDATTAVIRLTSDKLKDIYFSTELKYGAIRDLYLTFIVAEKATRLYAKAYNYMEDLNSERRKTKE